jgi:NDP-sugar pyrophosphorylase family protein/aminoglycoside/choline kinase family phosphotransferase
MIKAFILAAGFGERLRPITSHIPKPLLPVLGKPVIGRLVERVLAVPVARVGVNAHYKAEMLGQWAETSDYADKIELYHEQKILGTGGALKNAERFLRGSTFLVHNADIFSDINLRVLIEKHISEGNVATLAVHNHHRFNNVQLDKGGRLLSVGDNQPKRKGSHRVAFTGIAVYSSEFLDLLPAGKSSVIDAWLSAQTSGLNVGTVNVTGCRWTDIGTAEAFSSLVFSLLKEEGEVLYIHPEIDCKGADLGARTVIEKGCIIEKKASVRSSILLPGAKVLEGSQIENAIVGPDYAISLKETLAIPSSLPSDLISGFLRGSSGKILMTIIGVGGSDRNYYRIRDGNKTAVLMECAKDDPDYQRHIIYTQFFKKNAVPVPELLGFDTGGSAHPIFVKRGYMYALFEDLGDISLYSWLKCQKETPVIEDFYRRVVDIMVNLHTRVSDNVSDCLLLKSRVFDFAQLRWESDYFIKRYVAGLRGISIPNLSSLCKEFDRLAAIVDTFEKVVVHRDFQSQNVMVANGDVPRIIDYQGARIGPPSYDLASLLWDPYCPIDGGSRERLLEYYINGVRDYRGSAFDEDAFRAKIIPCRLQRHMQALGAYGFLSVVKGRSYFLKYIPQALQYLKEEVKVVKNDYPLLCELIAGLDEKIEY